ncbi:LLM class F420-dependent oxidoreductase [Nakamurella lactea]|uniref:LLM class F420-dependent oxidoreductase n=1 Tax=Nakamurella lactea TaxID=459515 RepID=UPI0004098E9D|nr:LLM class F420-dependent oxidoreductase [Nakamurella lactea]
MTRPATLRYGMTVPLGGLSATEQLTAARKLAAAGYTDLWSSEVSGPDCFTPLAIAAAADAGLRLGTAIASVYTRGPGLLAQSGAMLGAIAPGRAILGIGVASPAIVQQWNGLPYEQPYQRARGMLRFLRSAFAGERVTVDSETLTVEGFRLDLAGQDCPPVYLAALREQMLRLAGREADGVIVNWLAADDMDTVDSVVRGAAPAGAVPEVVVRLIVVPTDDADRARALGRRLIAAYLTVPAYAAFHDWLGRGDQLATMQQRWADGDRRGALAAVPDSVVDDLIIHGTPQECAEHIERYRRDHNVTPVLALQPVGRDPLDVAREIIAAR